ncbi:hypothetical protein Tco_1053652 [Tanacetum coccineum]|uniref:RNA-directed DNA polymerase, eukaryota, reverse transcriptase zinc-binding domain protein n=1 Tax=Tanacetum coccineum TaxID=301880 RepID=A0ABQ5GUI0_9ASTR
MSFFVTNFPESLDAKNLWKEFQRFGRIVDAFIANKRSKTVANGGGASKGVSDRGSQDTSSRLSLSDNDLIKFDSVAGVKEKKASHPCNPWKEERSGLDPYVSPSFMIDERLIWIEIIGLPLCAWGSNAIKKVTSLFGKFKFFDSDSENTMSLGRACISTKRQSTISESVSVIIHGKSFDVHVHEIGAWSTIINDEYREPDEKNGEAESHTLNKEENPMGTLDDFVEQVVEEKENHTLQMRALMLKLRHQMNRMIEVGDALGYDVKGCKRSLRKMLNGIGGQASEDDRMLRVNSSMSSIIREAERSSHASDSPVILPSMSSAKSRSDSDRHLLDFMVSLEEIKNAVWDCVMEGLHIALKDGLTANLFQGVKIGSSEIRLSHLFYADDVIILFEWNQCDMDKIIRILNVFYLASGLKINISKSNLFRVGVSSDDIESMAAGTGCSYSNLPFSYLGLPIGSNMNLIANWNSLIERFKIRLSGWKANMLSLGGRLTLIKSVLGSPGDTRKLAWIKWSNILASLDKGGLRVLKSIHGNEAGIELKGCQTNGLWARIVGMIYHLHLSGYVTLYSLRYQVGNGSMIRFWKDTWLGDAPLCSRFNRLFRLEKNQNCLVRDRIVNGLWAWDWRRPVNGGRALADLNNLLMDIGSLNVEVDRDCVVSSLSTDGSYSLPIFGGLFVVGVSLKSRRYIPVMNGTYGTPRGMLQKSRKTELMSFSPPLVRCFGVIGITTFSILKT